MSDLDFGDDEFLLTFPLWFVVMERFTELDVATNRQRLKERQPECFCWGVVESKRCILAFSDDDLADRFAKQAPGLVPVAFSNPQEVIEMLEAFYPKDYHSVLLDMRGDQKCSKLRIPIPKFIESLRKPL